MTQTIKQTLRDSAGWRWTALLLLALAMFCSYIFMDILSPIKDLMQETRGWDSLAFGTMQGAETFLNVFIFFLIFAGIILDKMGVRFTAILSGAVMLVGAIIKWYAVTDAFKGSGLETWFTNNLNYIPGFDELGVSPFYEGMPASAKFAAVGFMILVAVLRWQVLLLAVVLLSGSKVVRWPLLWVQRWPLHVLVLPLV